jgi:hypothetical protein
MALSAILGGTVPSFCAMAVLFAVAAGMTGQALARNWRPAWQVVPYALLLGGSDRFLLFALFGGALLSATGYAVISLLLLLAAIAAYRRAQAWRMVRQYPWLYERAGWFAWRARDARDQA